MIEREKKSEADGKVEQYMAETQQFIELLKRNLYKKILRIQQTKETNSAELVKLHNHSLN